MIGICGASGYIGLTLYNYLGNALGTYCNHPIPGLVKFDLRTDDFNIFDKCSAVVILSGYAKIKFCEENRQEAYDLNVYHTERLLEYLHSKGIPSLFVSGECAIRPNTWYGLCKMEVENYIDQRKLNSQYIRPGKITKDNIEELCIIIKRRING